VVGPICETGDILAIARKLPPVARGELLAIHTAGAYGMCMASNYNAMPRPAEVLVEGDQWRVIRRRETYEDLTAAEIG
jgi:diaminopimelate decarboxylase